jgi:hypothetical protein
MNALDVNIRTILFTRTQLDEMRFKVEVMETDYPESGIVKHYGLDRDGLEALRTKVSQSPRARALKVDLTEREAVAMYGELGNAHDIADDNAERSGDPYALAAARFRDGQVRILMAFPNAAILAKQGMPRD